MDIAPARVSTDDQTLSLQLDALKQAGCARIHRDIASGAKADRPRLTRVLEEHRTGDTFVAWRLDRLGRTLKQLIELVTSFEERGSGIGFRSFTEHGSSVEF